MNAQKHFWKKLISILLAFVVVFQLMPLQILAEKSSFENTDIVVENVESDAEATESIDENEDGVAQSNKNQGEITDSCKEKIDSLDNTPQNMVANASSIIEISNNQEKELDCRIIGEITEKREENVKHFLNDDGSFTAIKYFEPVHYRESENAEWKDIDNTLVLITTSTDNISCDSYVPKDSPLNVNFSKEFNNEKTASLESQGYELFWAYEEKGMSNSLSVLNDAVKDGDNIDAISTEEQELAETKTITAQKIPKILNERSSDSEKITELYNLTDGIIYPNIYPDVDLEYILDSTQLKENIVLKKDTASAEYYINYCIGELEAKQVTNNEIDLLNENGDIIFAIAAPYMVDSAGAICENVSLKIASQDSGNLHVKLSADTGWLKSNDRVYPVRIDPYVSEAVKEFDKDATAMYKSTTYPYGSLVVGNDKGSVFGKAKSFVQFSLPVLSEGDIVIGGFLDIAQFNGTYGYSHVGNPNMQINAYLVTSAWNESTVRNTVGYSGLPTTNSLVLDYQEVGSRNDIGFVRFDISRAVKSWYDGTATNYGICLRANDEEAWAAAKFIASDNPSYSNGEPHLVVNYRNNKGLEDYWTYHTQSVGESGAGYINDYNGNLVFIADLFQMTGNRMPLNISLVYNGYMANKTGPYVSKCGNGWSLSIQQKLIAINSSTSTLYSKLYNSGYRYIFVDNDGTEHYLYIDSNNRIVDEDGLGIVLTVYSSVNSNDEKYELAYKDGSKTTFAASGNIRRVYDSDGNYIHVLYSSTVAGKIIGVKDGANRRTNFTSDDNNKITSATDPAGRTISIEYSGGNLSRIVYQDNTFTSFTYTNGKLTSVHGRDGGWLKYSYPTSGDTANKSRVTEVAEYSSADTGSLSASNRGNSLAIDYNGMNRTKFTDNKNRSETYTFDNAGRTINIFDASGGASMYVYEKPASKSQVANELKVSAQTQKYIYNFLLNHSFESGITGWTNGGASVDTAQHYLGTKSIKLTQNTYVAQKVAKSTGTYNASVYAKGTSLSSSVQIKAYFYDSSDTLLSSNTSENLALSSDWTRISHSFSLPNNTSYFKINITNSGSTDVWIDCVQVENNAVMNAYNLVENGAFEDTASTAWTTTNFTSTDGYSTNTYYSRSVRIKGSANADKHIGQKIVINRPAKDLHFTVSGKSNGDSVPLSSDSRKYGININTHFTDGTTANAWINFNPSCVSMWQFASDVIGYDSNYSNKTVDYIYVNCAYYKNENYTYFDQIQVNLDESGTSYTYDGNGKLISATDNAGRHRRFDYNSANELVKLTAEDNKEYNFIYSTANVHRLESAIDNSAQLKYSFTYDSYGNPTAIKQQKSDDSGRYISMNIQYSTNGNYVTRIKSDRGWYSYYNYDANKGTLTDYTDFAGNVTSYTYDNNDRLTTATSDTSTVGYTYNSKGYLTAITSPSTTYNFSYDGFGNCVSTTAGNTRTLADNTYAANNGLLTSQSYGNGDTVGYTYDSLDRVISENYNGTTKFRWDYNAFGQVGTYEDLGLGKKYTYIYDNIGRLVRSDVSDGSWYKTNYNTIDQSTSAIYNFDGVTRQVDYTYSSADNALERTAFSSNCKVDNKYDSLRRFSGLEYTVTCDTTYDNITADYTYLDWTSNANRTSNTVRGIKYSYTSGGLTIPDIYYEYDHAGTITAEREWLPNASENPLLNRYTYDSKNQLVCHDSITSGLRTEYTYDNAGNILSRTETPYDFETDEATGTSHTVSYAYGNPEWGDLLTNYNGQSISYDEIGNPTSYLSWDMAWEGRRLVSASNGTDEISYTYDANGIRTSKTVNNVTTEYFLNGSQILATKKGSVDTWFIYDANGMRIGMITSNNAYYYIYNLQGDVIALALATTGEIVAKYTYDAWGNCTVQNASGWTAGDANPFRYRGYYYDTETGLYYLQSRYYDPEVGRFISADAFASTDVGGALSTNMFAYCENNPIVRSDPTGEIYHIIAGAAIGALINMGTQILANSIAGVPLTDNLGIAAITGAVSGAFAASGVGAVGQGLVGAATNIASYVATTPKEEINTVECAIEATIGFVSGKNSGAGLTATKKVASQVSIINKNMHAANTNWRAARTINVCMKRISGEIQKRINRAINGGFLSAIRQGVTSRLWQLFGR